jgi:hypothetical protein
LARILAVAAPRPDAEPVTITHKPSFDIVSSCCLEGRFSTSLATWPALYHTIKRNAKLR